ncbi:C-type lectin domain family 5 member A-like [Eublepharis macularius]|uniref:C-type lectin domain family 5 member A-like n=1 Tax=Eublepharis macularius TaxID=481883 RepID=A0AA97L5G9_EUBMA|nr:C-type lectin domain family 5 member A-like [Eublepharis macularius]XP_054843380.1 C-type lectin domain family 5 member A-like [Eublepharis macularius]
MNGSLVIQVVTVVILKLIASSLFLVYFSQVFYTSVLQEDPTGISKENKACSIGWKLFKGKCYDFFSQDDTWDGSQKTCAQSHSHLAVVNSKEELMFLKSRSEINNDKYFIGLTRRDGKWTWVDGTPFDPNRFSINYRIDGDCAVIGFGSLESFETVHCYGPYRCICEKNA